MSSSSPADKDQSEVSTPSPTDEDKSEVEIKNTSKIKLEGLLQDSAYRFDRGAEERGRHATQARAYRFRDWTTDAHDFGSGHEG